MLIGKGVKYHVKTLDVNIILVGRFVINSNETDKPIENIIQSEINKLTKEKEQLQSQFDQL